MLPDAMGNTSAGAAHEVLGLLSKLTEMMDSLSSEVTARVIEPINGYLSGELAEAQRAQGHRQILRFDYSLNLHSLN